MNRITSHLRRLARDTLPPALTRALACLLPHTRFTGQYASWEEAGRDARGYDASLILERVRSAAAQVRDGRAVCERDGVLFDRPQYSFPVLAGLLRAAAMAKGPLEVLDLGGSLGSTYYQVRGFVGSGIDLRWNIVEQSAMVQIGQKEFQTDHLRFYADLDACFGQRSIDVILLSSVLPYLPRPYDVFQDLLRRRVGHLIVDRNPFLQPDADRLTVQHVPASIYGAAASYPAWLFDRRRLLSMAQDEGYRLLAEFESADGQLPIRGRTIVFGGFILARE